MTINDDMTINPKGNFLSESDVAKKNGRTQILCPAVNVWFGQV